MTGFEQIPVSAVVIVTAFAVLAQIIDYVAGVIGARRYGASQAGVWGSVIGSVVGIFFFPPFGFLIGAVVGAGRRGTPLQADLQGGASFGLGRICRHARRRVRQNIHRHRNWHHGIS